MSEQEEKKSTKYSHRLTSGPIWTKKGTERNPEEIFYTGIIDFGILGSSSIMIFKRKPKDGDKENMPDYTISTSYDSNSDKKTKEMGTLVNIGSLWKKEYTNDKGEKVPYISGIMSAGIHGEYQVAIFSIDPRDRKNDKSPDKIMHVSVQRDKKSKANFEETEPNDGMNEEEVPF